MIYKFIDNKGTFKVKNPQRYNLYFPLTNSDGTLLSSISPNLGGDIKSDNSHFLTPPASIIDLKNNLLCRREFFIKTSPLRPTGNKSKTIRVSDPHNDRLEAGLLYHKLTKKAGPLQIEVLNFVPSSMAVEIMSVRITNRGSEKIRITPTSLIPLYGRGENTLRDHRHVSSLLNRIRLNKYGIFLKPTLSFNEKGHSPNKTTYFCLGFQDDATAPIGQFPTLDYFSGEGSLLKPQSIGGKINPVTKEKARFQGKETAAAFRFEDKILGKGKSANYFLILGIDSGSGTNSRKRIMNGFNKINSRVKISKIFEETKKYWSDYLSRVEFDFKDRSFNNWLLWVKLQPTLRKLFGCSFLPHFDYGKGGRGWRDLWQDTLTLLINEPAKAKKLLLNSFKGIRIDGSNATIITKKGRFVSDRNKISRVWSDHGIWPLITLDLYINKTGDLGILDRETAYFRDHLLDRAKRVDCTFCQQDFFLRNDKGNIYEGTILEHLLVQHLTSFFNVGEHNIIRLENADWNDGLDMASAKGESVAFSHMYAHNLRKVASLLRFFNIKMTKVSLAKELFLLLDRTNSAKDAKGDGKSKISNKINKPVNYNDFKAKQKRLNDYLKATRNISGQKQTVRIHQLIEDLEKKSSHLSLWLSKKEWLKSGSFNGYYDNKGKRVEGRGRINLASQVFAIMSGVAGPEQVKKTWKSIKKYLYDKNLDGFRLNTDFGNSYLDLGRAYSFSYGDKENGAFFNHMAIMLANSLYRRGFVKEGSFVLGSIYRMSSASRAKIYPLIPEYFNSSGEGLYSYLTGSASWYIYTLLEEALGLSCELGDILLSPKLMPGDFFKSTIEAKYTLAGKTIRILYRKGKGPKISRVFLEDKEISEVNGHYKIKRSDLARIKGREITLRIYFA